MRERGALGFYAVILIVTVIFFTVTAGDEYVQAADESRESSEPTVMINGRAVVPSFVDQGKAGRMVIVVDQEDLFIGENTVEIHWGSTVPSTMTAELPSELQKR